MLVIVDGKPVGQSTIQGEGAGPEATTSAFNFRYIVNIKRVISNSLFQYQVAKKLKFFKY